MLIAVTAVMVDGGLTKAGQHDGVDYYTDGDDTAAAVDDGALGKVKIVLRTGY